ncbi:MAG TPA: UPF0175 family protein [Pyrinomonadaceae bacterium]|jgi:hypothetical protein
MDIEIELPEDVAQQLEAEWGAQSLPRKALEALTLEAYRCGVLSGAQLQSALGFSSRWETEAFLKRSRAYLDYAETDLDEDSSRLAAPSTSFT